MFGRSTEPRGFLNYQRPIVPASISSPLSATIFPRRLESADHRVRGFLINSQAATTSASPRGYPLVAEPNVFLRDRRNNTETRNVVCQRNATVEAGRMHGAYSCFSCITSNRAFPSTFAIPFLHHAPRIFQRPSLSLSRCRPLNASPFNNPVVKWLEGMIRCSEKGTCPFSPNSSPPSR